MIGDTNWNKDQIRKYLQPVVAYSKAYNVAIYVGEFSAVRWSNGGNQWLADVIDVMEENHWDWSYHAFREWQGWDAEYPAAKEAMGRSQEPTPRVTLLKSYFALNQAKL